MLDQMVKIAKEVKPDLFLVSGDVYHTADPKPAVQKMFNKAIADLCKACPEMTIVVTAGNHDSGTKHEIFKTPWEALNVHVVGKFDKDNLKSHIIEVTGKGYVIALPFTYDRFLPEDIYQQMIDLVNEKNTENLPIVFSAHTAISGVDFSGHEDANDKRVGGVDIVDVSSIGHGYDYLALGHIHKPQFVHTGKHNVRYSGSPMAVSFDEAYAHSVTIVDIPEHGIQLTDDNYTIKVKYDLSAGNMAMMGQIIGQYGANDVYWAPIFARANAAGTGMTYSGWRSTNYGMKLYVDDEASAEAGSIVIKFSPGPNPSAAQPITGFALIGQTPSGASAGYMTGNAYADWFPFGYRGYAVFWVTMTKK